MSIAGSQLHIAGCSVSHIKYMEVGEIRTMPIGDRIRARFEYVLRPTGPISKEVVFQIKKIQAEIPKGAAWDMFEKIKNETPGKLTSTDAEYKKSSMWDAALKFVKMTFFFSPLVVMATDGPSSASMERKKIRKSAKEWRRYLTKNPEGKKIVASYQGKDGGKRIQDIMLSIMSGAFPKEAKSVVSVG